MTCGSIVTCACVASSCVRPRVSQCAQLPRQLQVVWGKPPRPEWGQALEITPRTVHAMSVTVRLCAPPSQPENSQLTLCTDRQENPASLWRSYASKDVSAARGTDDGVPVAEALCA